MSNTEINKGVDIVYLIKLLWSKRVRIFKNVVIAGVLAIIIAFSIPKEYTSTTVLAPEFSKNSIGLSGNLASLASMTGIDLSQGGEDALYPELYPQIVSSTPFLCSLMSEQVETKDKELNTTLYDYLRNHQRCAWWEWIMALPGKTIQKLSSKNHEDIVPSAGTETMYLTRTQQLSLKSLNKRIKVDVDKGTSVITLSVTMQDPNIAAVIAGIVSSNLQTNIARYRSAKSIKDLEFNEKIFQEAKTKYYTAQQEYAEYADQHQNLYQERHKIEMTRLENDVTLAYEIYSQVAGQLEVCRAKVQDNTPVCVVIEPPVAPFKASHPKKMVMGVLYCFLAFFGTCAWYIVKERLGKSE